MNEIDELLFSPDLRDVLKGIRQGGNVNAKTDRDDSFTGHSTPGNTPLHFLVEVFMSNGEEYPLNRDHVRAIKVLVGAGADINATNEKGKTPLHIANDERVAQVLIDAGADVNFKDSNGETKLHQSISKVVGWNYQDGEEVCRDDHAMIKTLINAGAKFDNKELFRCEDSKTVSLLVGAGADVNYQNDDGDTALHKSWDRRMTSELLRFGADPTIKNNKGMNAYQELDSKTNCWGSKVSEGVLSSIKAEMIKRANEQIIKDSLKRQEAMKEQQSQGQEHNQQQVQRQRF